MKKLYLLYLIVILFSSGTLFAQIYRTLLNDVSVNDINRSSENLIVSPSDKLTFAFSNDFEEEKQSSINYSIYLNDEKLIANYTNSSYTLTNLLPGKYKFQVQAIYGIEQESILAETVFDVTPDEKNNAENQSSSSDNLLTIKIFFSSIIVVLFGVILFLIGKLKKKKQKTSVLDEFKKVEAVTENETLKDTILVLKRNFKQIEEENKRLKKTIFSLNKTIMSLEDANFSLIEQKETLLETKLKLEDLQKQKDELLAIKFHDIKNPANAIKGLVELLEDYDLTAIEQQEIMTSIVESSANIVELVHSIADAFAKEKYDDAMILELGLLQNVIQSVVTINAAYAKKKQIRLLNNASASMPEFKFDALKIKEALDNLINNAIKYSLPDTDVFVRSFLTESKVFVEVKDNGVGMTPQDLSLIFEKGAKLSSQPTGGEKSSGLGLWIVKKIIEGHGGKITVESKKGIGTKFTFELPFKTE